MILLTKEFTDCIKERLVPALEQHGFNRNGIDNYQRYMKPFIHCIWLQARSEGDAICVNFGVHLDFLPIVGISDNIPIEKIEQIHCEIKDRLASSRWWPALPAKEQVTSLITVLKQEGMPYFERFSSFPGIFDSITVNDIESGKAIQCLPRMTNIRIALLLARVNEHVGKKEMAVQFAQYGLKNIGIGHPQKGKALIKTFQDIIQRNS